MKRLFLTLALIVVCASSALAQLNFRLTYGTLNSKMATVGYDLGRFSPYVGLEALTLNFDFNMPERSEISLKGSIVAPMIGTRYTFLEVGDGKLRGYGNFAIQKLFIGGTYETYDWDEDPDTGEEVWVGQEYKLSDMFSSKNLWQFQVGIGAEYFFDDYLSLVAEYGFRAMTSKFEGDGEQFDGLDIKANLGLTYTRLGLAFHF